VPGRWARRPGARTRGALLGWVTWGEGMSLPLSESGPVVRRHVPGGLLLTRPRSAVARPGSGTLDRPGRFGGVLRLLGDRLGQPSDRESGESGSGEEDPRTAPRERAHLVGDALKAALVEEVGGAVPAVGDPPHDAAHRRIGLGPVRHERQVVRPLADQLRDTLGLGPRLLVDPVAHLRGRVPELGAGFADDVAGLLLRGRGDLARGLPGLSRGLRRFLLRLAGPSSSSGGAVSYAITATSSSRVCAFAAGRSCPQPLPACLPSP